jgi:hypothetical protein
MARGGNQNVLLGEINKKKIEENKKEIIKYYQEHLSVRACSVNFKISYSPIESMLKQEGVHRGISDKERCKKNFDRLKNSVKNKYGITNVSQLHLSNLKERNSIEFKRPKFMTSFVEYSKEVKRISNKNKKLLKKQKYCYYTGIIFADSDENCGGGGVNPNDPTKRTLDHKISVFDGFMNNIEPQIIASPTNLVECLRYCNSVKGNMSADQFLSKARLLREAFINEGYQHN